MVYKFTPKNGMAAPKHIVVAQGATEAWKKLLTYHYPELCDGNNEEAVRRLKNRFKQIQIGKKENIKNER